MKRQYRTMFSWLLSLALALSVVTVPGEAAAKSIQLKNCTQTKIMPVGSTFLLLTNQKAAKLKFSSNQKKVASVSGQGLIKAEKKGTAVITITSGKNTKKIKVRVKNPTGYSITKKAGKYTTSVATKVTAKKGYTVYYTVSGKFKKSQCIRTKKTKSFSFAKTTTLKIYPVKASVKMTTAKLNKTEAKDKNRGDYLYQITAAAGVTPSATASGGAVDTAAPASTASGGAASTAPVAPSPGIGGAATEAPVPVKTPDSADTPDPDGTPLPVKTPDGSGYTGDDSLSDYVAPVEADYDGTDTDTDAAADAVQITIPAAAPSVKIIEDTYEISKKNKLTLTSAGTFVLKTEGTGEVNAVVAIDKTVSGTLHLILDGVHLKTNTVIDPTDYDDQGVFHFTNKNDDESRRIVVTVKEGTTNSITNTGASAVDESDGSVYYPVGIYCKKQPLTINGAGTLQMTCENGVGIKVSKILKREDGTKVATGILKILDTRIEVNGGEGKAAGHNGITAKHGLFVKNAALEISSNGDGLKTSLDAEDVAEDSSLAELGNMTIEGGRYSITSYAGDAVSACRTLKLCPEYMEAVTKNNASTGDSRKALKAGETIYIPSEAGTIIADTTASYNPERAAADANDPYADDTLHCDRYIRIDGGNLQLSAGDDAIHADYGLVVNDGTIVVKESHEGLESADITINGGTVSVRSRDDGFNAGGGNDSVSGTNPGGGMGGDHFDKGESASVANSQVIINGGTVTIDAEGDGIDSNGNIFFRGGSVTIDGPTKSGNGALDYGDHNGVCEISGGTLIAAGAKGMDAAPTDGSCQPTVNVVFASPQAAGTYVVIRDAAGNTVMTAQPAKTFQSVIMSCGQLQLGSAYTVYTGTALDHLTETAAFTFSSVSVAAGSGSAGGWNPGGFQPGGRR